MKTIGFVIYLTQFMVGLFEWIWKNNKFTVLKDRDNLNGFDKPRCEKIISGLRVSQQQVDLRVAVIYHVAVL